MKKLAIDGGKPLRPKGFPERFPYDKRELDIITKIMKLSIKTGIPFRYNDKYSKIYEKKFIKFMNGGFCNLVNSGTNALLASIASLKLKTKSDILVPCLTDVGCVTPIIILGFKPIPVDICKKNFNVSLDEIKKKITKNTSAVIVAHIGGEVTDIDKISKYLKSKKIKLIEDCSQSHGAMYKKNKVGTFGDISFFSTMSSKLHTTGGTGGVIFSRYKNLIHNSKLFSDRGKYFQNSKFTGKYISTGLNLTIDELSSAIGTIQLDKLSLTIKRTNFIGEYIKKKLIDNKSPSKISGQYKNTFNVYWFLRITLDLTKIKVSKKKYCEALKKEGLSLSEKYIYNPFYQKWIKDHKFKKKLKFPNYDQSLKKNYVIFIRENYNKKDVQDIIRIIKKVDNEFKK